MATKELLPRTFDAKAGTVVAYIEDDRPDPATPGGKHVSIHTFYVSGVPDIDVAIAAKVTEVDAESRTIMDRMRAAGWQG